MNFKDNQNDVRQLLKYPDRVKSKISGRLRPRYFPGCYLITRKLNDNEWKVGTSSNLYMRLKDYKICWPYEDEFYIDYLVISATSSDSKSIEKQLLNEKKLKEIKFNPLSQGKNSQEYRVVTKKVTLKTVVKKVLESNRNEWTHIIVFGLNGWRVLLNKGSNRINLQKPSSRTTKRGKLF